MEAIKRIDETTRVRFVEAFAAINRNFQEVSRHSSAAAVRGLLLDENDPSKADRDRGAAARQAAAERPSSSQAARRH